MTFDSLPDLAKRQILMYLPVRQRMRCERVCLNWKSQMPYDDLSELDVLCVRESLSVLKQLCWWAADKTLLELLRQIRSGRSGRRCLRLSVKCGAVRCRRVDVLLSLISRAGSCLHRLAFQSHLCGCLQSPARFAHILGQVVAAIADHCPQFSSLDLVAHGFGLSPTLMEPAAHLIKQLTLTDITLRNQSELVPALPNLDKLTIDSKHAGWQPVLASLGGQQQAVVVLKTYDRSCFLELFECRVVWPRLSGIEIGRDAMADSEMVLLLEHGDNIAEVSLLHCSRLLSFECLTTRAATLKKLHLYLIPGLNNGYLRVVCHTCTLLETVMLKECCNVTDFRCLSLLDHLQALQIDGHYKLETLQNILLPAHWPHSLRLVVLPERVSFARNVVESLSACCPNLEVLQICYSNDSANSFAELLFTCEKLRELNMCNSVLIELTMVELGRHTSLVSVDIRSCWYGELSSDAALLAVMVEERMLAIEEVEKTQHLKVRLNQLQNEGRKAIAMQEREANIRFVVDTPNICDFFQQYAA